MRRMPVLCAALLVSAAASSHEGHGLPAPHLHGQEWPGLLLAAAAGVALWWWARRGR